MNPYIAYYSVDGKYRVVANNGRAKVEVRRRQDALGSDVWMPAGPRETTMVLAMGTIKDVLDFVESKQIQLSDDDKARLSRWKTWAGAQGG